MDFQISALNADDFSHLYGLSETELTDAGVKRMLADVQPGFPCRVSLEDAQIGETVLLMNYSHLDVPSPYRSRHAIFVREGAVTAQPDQNEVPESLRLRLLSLRAFDAAGMMIDADLAHGRELEENLSKLLEKPGVSYVHLHNAKPGCFAARVERC